MSVAIVAFTGGLDSTWCLYDILRKDKFTNVMVMQTGVGGPATQYIAEMFARRSILKELARLFPNKTIKEFSCPVATIYPNQNGRGGNDNPQLVQQLNTYMALFKCATSISDLSTNISCVTGWHKDDVFENDPNEGMLQEHLEQYKDILGTMFRSVNICSPSRIILSTPAWDKTKMEMWTELPRSIRNLIAVADGYEVTWDDTKNRIDIEPIWLKKTVEYEELGIVISQTTRSYQLDHLTPLDLWGVNANKRSGWLTAFLGCPDYLSYLYVVAEEKLGNAAEPIYGIGLVASGYSCISGKDLEELIQSSNRRTTSAKDEYDELFYGNHSDDNSNVVSIQSSENLTGTSNIVTADDGQASDDSEGSIEQPDERVSSS